MDYVRNWINSCWSHIQTEIIVFGAHVFVWLGVVQIGFGMLTLLLKPYPLPIQNSSFTPQAKPLHLHHKLSTRTTVRLRGFQQRLDCLFWRIPIRATVTTEAFFHHLALTVGVDVESSLIAAGTVAVVLTPRTPALQRFCRVSLRHGYW